MHIEYRKYINSIWARGTWSSLYYSSNPSVNLKLFNNKLFFKTL